MYFNCWLSNKNYEIIKQFYFMNKNSNEETALKQAESIAKEKNYNYINIMVGPRN